MKPKTWSEPRRRLDPRGVSTCLVEVKTKSGKARQIRKSCYDGFYSRVWDSETKRQGWVFLAGTIPEARKVRLALMARELRGEPGITVADFSGAFKEWLGLKSIRPSTKAEYEASFTGVYEPYFKRQNVNDVQVADIERFMKHIRDKRNASARTQQKHLTMLRSFFAWARRRRLCRENPTDGLRVARGEKRRKGTALKFEEAGRLLAACRTPIVKAVTYSNRTASTQTWTPPGHLFLAILTSFYTGLRQGNVLRLRWSQVDLDNRRISIPAGEMKAHEDHEVPIHPQLAEALREILHGRDNVPGPDELVLGVDVKEIHRSFKTVVGRADLPSSVKWHDLRHTFASWMATRCTYAALRQLMGHSPGDVTGGYVHVPFEELRQAVDGLPQLSASPPPLMASDAAQ